MKKREKEYECIACNKVFASGDRIELHTRTFGHRLWVRNRFPECTNDLDDEPWWRIDVRKRHMYLRYRGEPYGDWESVLESLRIRENEKKRRQLLKHPN